MAELLMIKLLPYELAIIAIAGIYLLIRRLKDGKKGR